MGLDVGGDPAVRQSLESNDTRSSNTFVPTGRAIPVLSVPTRPSRVVLCRQRAGVASNIRGKTNLRRPKSAAGSHFHNPPADVTLSTRASVMALFRKPRAQSSAVCLLLGAVAVVLGIIGLVAHHTHQQAASHHDVIHHFHSSSSRLDVGSDTPVKLGAVTARVTYRSIRRLIDFVPTFARGSTRTKTRTAITSTTSAAQMRQTSANPCEAISEDVTSHSVSIADQCGESHANTEYWGDVVEEGTVGLIRTPEECCRRCAETTGCNVWVHCGDDESRATGSCWLKRTDDPNAPTVHASGANVLWTSGTVLKDFDPTPGKGASLGASEAFVARHPGGTHRDSAEARVASTFIRARRPIGR